MSRMAPGKVTRSLDRVWRSKGFHSDFHMSQCLEGQQVRIDPSIKPEGKGGAEERGKGKGGWLDTCRGFQPEPWGCAGSGPHQSYC